MFSRSGMEVSQMPGTAGVGGCSPCGGGAGRRVSDHFTNVGKSAPLADGAGGRGGGNPYLR